MSIQFRSFALVSFSLFALACGGDDPEKVQDKCETLVTTYCDRVVSCADDADLLNGAVDANDLRDECESFLEDNAHCEDAIRVSKDYGECIRESKVNSCAAINESLLMYEEVEPRYLSVLPDSCVGAVEYPE
jgi:hypothetical protein